MKVNVTNFKHKVIDELQPNSVYDIKKYCTHNQLVDRVYQRPK